jgi:glycine/D-amino acid oxidase-like deaminating enzyme
LRAVNAVKNAAPVVVVGAGQAGLAVSHELTEAGIEHVVLERGRVGQTWRGRWESFCLVTPNWSLHLPVRPYVGDDPDGFMLRDAVVSYLERYAAGFEAPVREGVAVTFLKPRSDGGLLLETEASQLEAEKVVLSTGAYQRPHRPAGAGSLPADLPARRRGLPQPVRSCRRVMCWLSAVASRAARSPKSSTKLAATSSSHAAGRGGRLVGSATTTSSGGSSKPAIWTRPLTLCGAPPHG